jgi:hypothetical protein
MTRFQRFAFAIGALSVLAGKASAQLGESKSFNFHDVDCKGLELKTATGVIPSGPKHTYRFLGSCRLLDMTKTLKAGIGGQSTTYSSKELDLAWVSAESEWTSTGGLFQEFLSVKGEKWSGKVSISLRCPKDPVVNQTTCVHVQYVNTTGFDGFDQAWLAKRPLTSGQSFQVVAEATKAGASGGTPNKPPPPPEPTPGGAPGPTRTPTVGVTRGKASVSGQPQPAGNAAMPPAGVTPPPVRPAPVPSPNPPPISSRGLPTAGAAVTPPPATVAGPLLLEAEAFLVTSGQAGLQAMSGFGPGWGGDSQLFWPAAQPGAQLRLQSSVPQDGRYRVLLVFTTAPDYGIAEASFDGSSAVSFNGYAQAVGRQRVLLGVFDLRAGAHDLLVTVRGQDNRSRGLFVGLDQLQLLPN